jgi:AAA domain
MNEPRISLGDIKNHIPSRYPGEPRVRLKPTAPMPGDDDFREYVNAACERGIITEEERNERRLVHLAVVRDWRQSDTDIDPEAVAAFMETFGSPNGAAVTPATEPAGTAQLEPHDDPSALVIVSAADFAAVDEPGTEPIAGDDDGGALIPEDGDVMIYGDGGAGKTTLAIDMACHLAAGDAWLDIAIPRPVRVLLIENEGPRPLFRKKLRGKLAGWNGSPVGDRLSVVASPWARVTFADPATRAELAGRIAAEEIDVVIVGPVTRSGMDEAGTLHEVRDFMSLVAEVRAQSGRRVAVVLVHHESKGGKVSGAWEGSGDTLLHVSAQGNGSTRLHVQKARWSSALHGTTTHLAWTDGEGFAVTADASGVTADELYERLDLYLEHNPGTSTTKVTKAVTGDENRLRELLKSGAESGRYHVTKGPRNAIHYSLAGDVDPDPGLWSDTGVAGDGENP